MPQYKSVIFTSRLIVFNKTFVPLGTSSENIFSRVWHESISGRKKEDLASTFLYSIMHYKNKRKFIILLDNCLAQNKNWCLMNF